jgi:hypothetical protein
MTKNEKRDSRSLARMILPSPVRKAVKYFFQRIYEMAIIWLQPYRHKRALKKVRKKVQRGEKVQVAFFITHHSEWKCDNVYKMMDRSNQFNPIVIVCPYITYGQDDTMLETMRATHNFFFEKNYKVINTYNEITREWVDVKKTICMDIIFFSYSYKLTMNEYYITNYPDTLTCYVPYGFMAANIQQMQFNQIFHNLCWKIFCETRMHVELHKKYATNKGRNVIFTGYPLLDELINVNIQNNPWKKQDKLKKKIIWAPHHTIEDNEKQLAYSCFLLLYDFMFEVAEKYGEQIQMAFKPHPLLKNKLYNQPDWGKTLTDEYYQKWKNLSNGQLEQGDYIDLFLSSDAMILDSISFISEYIVTQKPSLFTIGDDSINSKFNEYGLLSFNMFYHANQLQAGITDFIENIIKEIDPMKNDRIVFMQKYLIPPNDKTASENIYYELKKEIS